LEGFNQRQGFLVSAIFHLTILMILVSHPPAMKKRDDLDPTQYELKDRVFLPPASVLKTLAPKPVPRHDPATPVPAPTPPPADPAKKDRISVGPPTDLHAKGPMILRREDDLTAVPKGVPDPPRPAPPAPPPSTTPAAQTADAGGGAKAVPGTPGLRVPPGLGRAFPSGQEGSPEFRGPLGPSIAGAIRDAERRIARDSALGIPTGTGQNIGGLFFDPQGADFTRWVNHFKNEVYRNWIVPQPALLGFRGRVDFEFTIERDGTMTGLRMIHSSGTPALDRAAQNALSGSRLLPLPDDYGPQRITMQVTFFYNEGPQGS
jgi:periplasmic protein TonB